MTMMLLPQSKDKGAGECTSEEASGAAAGKTDGMAAAAPQEDVAAGKAGTGKRAKRPGC